MTTPRFAVYALADPFTGEVRYVGIASDVKRRYDQHCGQRVVFHAPRICKVRWIAGLRRRHRKPALIILQGGITDPRSARVAEIEWTRSFVAAGHRLLNDERRYRAARVRSR